MTKEQYALDLQTPEWKAKATQVKERDSYTCQQCGKTKSECLFVCTHHIRYQSGKRCWESPLEDLVIWCNECHDELHKTMQDEYGGALFGESEVKKLKRKVDHTFEAWSEVIQSELDSILIQIYMAEKDQKVADLEESGAIWHEDLQFYHLNGKNYGQDADLL